MNTIQHTLLATSLLAASSASAAINITTVPLGDAGNANDSTGYGGVSYAYNIGTYEVTNSQYTAFLNATAVTDEHSLYNTEMNSSIYGGINRAGASGSYTYSVKSGFGDKPVNFVSYWDATRFSNWLTNGQPTGPQDDSTTETGAYTLTTDEISNNTVTRGSWYDADVGNTSSGTVFAVTSENEWYKAAYYQPVGAGGDTDSYWLYPTASNSITTSDANYIYSVGNVTDVGTYAANPSYYGTFDQGGNVREWNDAIVSASHRGRRGGPFNNVESTLASSNRNSWTPHSEFRDIGFRVSSLEPIPEPSSYALLLGGLALGLTALRRR